MFLVWISLLDTLFTWCKSQSAVFAQDAHEFLSQCLDQLKEDVEKINKSWKNEPSAGEEPQSARLTEEVDTSRIYTCPVTVNMEFEVQHTITCKRWVGRPCVVSWFLVCSVITKCLTYFLWWTAVERWWQSVSSSMTCPSTCHAGKKLCLWDLYRIL